MKITKSIVVVAGIGLFGVSLFAETTWVLDKSSGNAGAYIISNDVWRFKFDYARGNLGAYQAGTGVLNLSNAYEDIHAVDSNFKFKGTSDKAINGISGITKIILPPTMTAASWLAFNGNPNLEEIVFNEGFKTTGAGTFSGNVSLKRVVMPNSFTTGGTDLFKGSTALEYVVLSSNMTSCGNNAFQSCPALTNITYHGYSGPCNNAWPPKCVSVPGNAAPSAPLKGSLDLTGVTSIGGSSFNNCDGLTEVVATNVVSIYGDAFSACDALATFKSSDCLKYLGNQAFNGDGALVSFTPMFPDTFTNIAGRCNFQNCKKLAGKVTIRNSDFVFTEGNAGISTFLNCTSLQDADLSGVKRFVNATFSGCTSLTNVILSTGLIDTGTGTFIGCTALVNCSNIFAPTCTTIGGNVFANCSALTNDVVISNPAITNVSGYVFSSCSSLSSVTLPPNATEYGRQFLELCRPNMDVYFLGKAPVTVNYRTFMAKDYASPYIFHACPKMDPEGWANLIKTPSANDLKRTLPPGQLLGVETTVGNDKHHWIVKWRSPLLPTHGLMVLVK